MIKQISFAKLEKGMAMPHLLDIQVRAFESLLQLDAAAHDREDVGLERVFKDLFLITDVHENFSLDFIRYTLGEPKYSVEECIERDMIVFGAAQGDADPHGVRGEHRRREKADQESDRKGSLPQGRFRCSRRSAPSSSTAPNG